MVQAWRKVDFGTGTVTFLDDTQKEDMLQVEYPNGFLLDMGWYQDRYIISIIQDFDWAHPVKRYETADRDQLPALLTKAVCFVEKESAFLHSILEWIETALTYTYVIVVEGNL